MTPLSFDYPISVLVLYTDYDQTTLDSVRDIRRALENEGHEVRLFKVTKANWRQSIRQSGEIVINLIEDPGWKLWGNVFRLFERLGRAQLGIDTRSFYYSLSKLRMKKRLKAFGLSTPDFRLIRKKGESIIRGLEYPLIVKPSGEHASEGIAQDSVVIDEKELADRVSYLRKRFGGEIMVERFIEGRELHVTVIGNDRHMAVLPYAEVVFRGEYRDNWSVFSYNAKWEDTTWEYWDAPVKAPAEVPVKWEKSIDELVKKAYTALGCRDLARFDIRLDEKGNPYIVDMNLLPSFSEDKDEEVWKSAQALGWKYSEFVETLVAVAYRRCYGRMPDRLRERELLLQAGI